MINIKVNIISSILFVVFLTYANCMGQRPLTDSVITLMISEMQKGNSDKALKLADKGYEFSLIEEPQNSDMWKAHFGLRKAQILLQIKGDLEEGEKLLNQLTKEEGIHKDKQALFWWLQLTNVKGKLYSDLGDFETAYDLHKKAYIKGAGDYRSEKNYYNYLTQLFINKKQFDSAHVNSKKLILINKEHGDTSTMRYCGNLLTHAYILSKQGLIKESDKFIDMINYKCKGFNNSNNQNSRINFLSKMVSIKGNSKDYVSALKYAKKGNKSL